MAVRFSPEIAERICDELKTGKSLRAVCRLSDMPSEGTVREWAVDDVAGFAAQYSRAREIGYLSLAEDVLEIADDSSGDRTEDGRPDAEFAARSRLRVDTRKWLLSKCLPKIYGDKLALSGHDGGALSVVVQRFSDAPEAEAAWRAGVPGVKKPAE